MHFFELHRGKFFGAALPILVGSVIYSGTLHLLRLSALSCIDVVVPSEVQLLLLIIRAQRPENNLVEKTSAGC